MPKKDIIVLIEIIFGTFLTLFGGAFLIRTILLFNLILSEVLTMIIFSIILILGLLLFGDALRK